MVKQLLGISMNFPHLILDCGEDKPDDHPVYAGMSDDPEKHGSYDIYQKR